MICLIQAGLKLDFSLLHLGQCQSSGSSENGVHGGMPCVGSPFSGSYTNPHIPQMYFPVAER